jgi:mediator of RNA polymerase II transcription subunit 5
MCDQRETMPLRSICSFLARKPSSIDVMLLFVKPAEVLEPLCDLLDTWRYEEDQGEYQPVYEEFGYILLLVLTLIHRYSFTTADLVYTHPLNPEAFISQHLRTYSTASRIEFLSTDHHAQLGGWIKELFEGEGISDGLMMSCRPQEFYALTPTLFSQSLLAITRGVLDLETVKEAFSFLLTPFLLPSVISGISVLTHALWASLDSPNIPLNLLAALVVAPSLSLETAETHRTVVSISARPLDAVLRELLRRPGVSQDALTTASDLLSHLKPHLGFKRAGTPTRDEIDSWIPGPSGGLSAAVAGSFNALLNWSQPGSLVPRPTYTHRLLVAAFRLLGGRKVVEIVVCECVKAQQRGEAQGVAEDLAAAVLTAHLPGASGRITLFEALKALEMESSMDGAVKTEIIGGLMRRIEAGRVPYVPVHAQVQEVEAVGGDDGGGEEVDLGGLDIDVGVGVDDEMDELMMSGDFVAGMLGDVGMEM